MRYLRIRDFGAAAVTFATATTTAIGVTANITTHDVRVVTYDASIDQKEI